MRDPNAAYKKRHGWKKKTKGLFGRVTLIEILVIVAIILILIPTIGAVVASLFLPFFNVNTHDITVTKVENVVHSSSSKYLIFTDGEVFENEDCLVKWKWDSSDDYNELKELGTFQVTTYGYRIPLLSMYRNIVEVHKKYPDKGDDWVDPEKEQRRQEYEKLKKEFE
jgi:hypothetical protein